MAAVLIRSGNSSSTKKYLHRRPIPVVGSADHRSPLPRSRVIIDVILFTFFPVPPQYHLGLHDREEGGCRPWVCKRTSPLWIGGHKKSGTPGTGESAGAFPNERTHQNQPAISAGRPIRSQERRPVVMKLQLGNAGDRQEVFDDGDDSSFVHVTGRVIV